MGNDSVTPMMAQYLEIRAANPGALLFYRMGDFYEMFFEDAVAASTALDIALTKRGKHLGRDIEMCGVPVHASEGYLLTLIRKGFRVAIAEQLEDPAEAKKRGSKAVVKRDVVRLVTPGTLTEDGLLEARRHNYLCAFNEVRDEYALAWVDISTGDLRVMACPAVRLGPELARLAPREVLLSEAREADWRGIVAEAGAAATAVSRAAFDSTAAEGRLCRLFGVSTLDAFGSLGRAEISALGAIVEYLEITQRGRLPLLRPPVRERIGGAMQIDAATRRNLEITQTLSGGREGSLLAAIDRTVTAGGARLLDRRLSAPSCDLSIIQTRQDSVAFLAAADRLRRDLREALRRVPDIDRSLSRLALDRGGPRDMVAIRTGLSQARQVAALLTDAPPLLAEAVAELGGHEALIARLAVALIDEPPLFVRDGGFIAPGHEAELDETRALRDEGRAIIAAMQAEYAAKARVPGLKIKHNAVLGYFIETTDTHADKMRAPAVADLFVHRQTTANLMRFTTVLLAETESRILNAGNHALKIEKRLYDNLRADLLGLAAPISRSARALAEIDVATALADLAITESWCAPVLDDSRALQIKSGRHPVVERALLRAGSGPFIANDCDLSDGEAPAIWLLTGPNMAGKSTFLRQTALIAVLAQTGSFVPATSARIGLVSQLFSRVGASDDLARGRSTFMVEMVETAAILNQADDRALVILDEIGRGTSTYDGLSIAWAVLEHLHDVNRCRGLFATHYHEMTGLGGRLVGVENATVAVKEWNGNVVFLHEVRKGAADRSYGVQVARLAGLPAPVIERAREVLEVLEAGDRAGERKSRIVLDDLPLFRAATPNASSPPVQSRVEARLALVNPDELTPKEALQLVYELRALV